MVGALLLAASPSAAAAVDGWSSIAAAKLAGSDRLSLKPTVTVRGTVTAFSGWKNSFFLQDETGGISIDRPEEDRPGKDRQEDTPVQIGDRVEVTGTLDPGRFAPIILSRRLTVLAKGWPEPKPQTASYEELLTGRLDSTWVELRGVIHSVQVQTVFDRPMLVAKVYVPGGSVAAQILDFSPVDVTATRLDSLVDSTVTVQGVCGTKFNDRRQMIGLRLFVPAMRDVRVESPAPDPARLKLTSLAEVRQFSAGEGAAHRVKVAGILTYQSRERGLYLEQQDGAAIHLKTEHFPAGLLRLGDRVEALGFPDDAGYSPGLRDAEVRRAGPDAEIRPVAVDAADIIQRKDGFTATAYDGRLVRLRATLAEQVENSQSQIWLLRRGNVLFQAELVKPDTGQTPVRFEAQSALNVTGICVAEMDENGDQSSFRILLRSADDLALADPPSSEPVVLFVLASLVLLLGGGFALWYFQRTSGPERQKELGPAQLEQLRGRFRFAAWALPQLVLARVLLSFAVTPLLVNWHASWLVAQANWAGPAAGRVALLLAALATLLDDSVHVWKRRCSLACVFLLLAIVCNPLLWQGEMHLLAGSVCLGGFACSVLLSRFARTSTAAQLIFVAAGGLGLFNLVTQLYGASGLHGLARDLYLPPLLAAGLLALSIAALCARPDCGLMKTLSSPGLGGLVGRRLLLGALAPIFIGWLRLQGQLAGLYDTLWGLALFAMSNVFSFGCVIWTSAAVLNRLDLARSKVAEALRQRENRLGMLFEKSGIGDYTWDIANDTLSFHPIVWRLYGGEGTAETAPGEWFRSRQHPDDAVMIKTALQKTIDQKRELDIEFRVILPDGGIRWLSCRGNVLYDADGVATHINGLNLDVTARKRSEAAVRKGMEALREADQQLRTSLELAKVPVWRWIAATNAVRWSGPVESIYGKSAAEVSTYDQFKQLVHPEDLADLDAKMWHGLTSGTAYEAQFRILVEGGIRWLAGRGDVLRDGNGEVYGLAGVNFDITATKLAERRLMESERSFRELADAMPQMVWIGNASGETEYMNRQWAEYTGSSDLRERHKFFHPDDLKTVVAGWQKARQTGESFEYEIRLKRASDDSYRWHLTRVVPIRDASGQILQWYGTSTDIEDFKQSQLQVESLNADLERRVRERSAELAESELRYRLLVEEVKDYAILLLDPQGLVKSWNKGAEQLTGYKAPDILGKHFSVFHSAASVAAGEPERSLAEAIAEERSKQEGWRVRQDGSEFWASVVTTSLWDSNGQLRGFSKIIRDMTEQRRVEGLLNKRAESATEAKSAFLASVSHEIRTPMNAILGMADMLWESDLNQSQRHYVEIFRRAGGSLLTLINDILDLSKIESGSFCLEEVDFDLTTMVEQVIEILTPKAEGKSISLRAQLNYVSAPTLVGDPVRLQQILLNLIGNAIKFTDEGEVMLRVQCHSDESFATVEFEVRDTGIGIPSHKLETIFDDFEQAETSTTRRFGGTGLGLGISRRLVRRMRGEIHAESELGKGSTFSFSLILPVGAKVKRLEHTQLEDIGGRQVLIVDPSAVNRVILSEMCSAWGMAVTNCASSAEAVELTRAAAGTEPFALALVDRMMPGMDGFETAEQMRRLAPKMAIFIVSSDSQSGDIARCRELGLAGHLMKPVRRAELLEQIVRALSRSRDEAPVQALAGPARRYRILAAEDSEDNRFLLHVYCEGSPYELTFVEDGERAVAAYQANSFDLIVMDIQMPVMDGLTATREIRQLEQESKRERIPILALTANAMPEDVSRAREAGCDTHVSKPISKKTFLGCLEQWLARTTAADSAPARAALAIEIPEGFEQLSPRYLAARQGEIAVLRELLKQADFENLRRLSHNMKGTGTSYGFPDISRLGAALEQASKNGNVSDLSEHIGSLADFLHAAGEHLRDSVQVDAGR